MVTWYWTAEYIKVLAGYIFLMFIWPAVVMRKFLNGRSTTFCFAFCVTFQPVLINTVVIVLGLFHILNVWVVRALFYIPFLIEVAKWLRWGKKEGRNIKHLLSGTYGVKMFCHNVLTGFGKRVRSIFRMLRGRCHSHWWEYGLLSVILIYGVIYFSWGAFQDYSYGFGDLYPHNAWIYGLVQGQIFLEGVYPEGMHCFLYGLHALFGIRIYSCLLFMAGIHVAVFLLSAYVLMKEVFCWKYTPMFVLAAFLTVDVVCINEVYSMSRLQWSLPMEFGLYSGFLCAAFLVRYLHSEKRIVFRGKLTKKYWDENLLVFMLALAASLAIHFYPTIMAFFLCFAFVPVHLRRIFSRERFLPLIAAAAAGFLIAVIPMGGALLSGIPFQGSIGWAMSVIDGTESQFISGTGQGSTGTGQGSTGTGQGSTGAEQGQTGVQSGTTPQGGGESLGSAGKEEAPEPIKEPLSVRIAGLLQRMKAFLLKELNALYRESYVTLYKSERAQWIVGFTFLALLIWLVYRLPASLLKLVLRRSKWKPKPAYFDQYLSITFASVLFMALYCASSLGLPALIAGSRLCTTNQMLILAMMGVPLDFLFSFLHLMIGEGVLKVASALVTAGIYVGTIMTGTFHGFLYYELTRFNGAALTTLSITETMPPYSFMIVSPVDELYQQIQYGWHEELLAFVNQSQEEEYRLPAEHIFIFIEKTPIEYAQSHFFTGPSWLACEKYADYYNSYVSQCPDITVSELIPSEDLGPKYVFEVSSRGYSILSVRTLVESLAYKWCQKFAELYPGELQTYYEDEHFVCYYFRQNPQSLYQLAILYQGEEERE